MEERKCVSLANKTKIHKRQKFIRKGKKKEMSKEERKILQYGGEIKVR